MVETLKRKRSSASNLGITPMVFFQGRHHRRMRGRGNYVTYVYSYDSDESSLNDAADWLFWYVEEYGGNVVTNYDQQRPAFKGAPFSLQNLMEGRLRRQSFESINIYHADLFCDQVLDIQAREVNMVENIRVSIGDGNIFHGDAIIGGKLRDIYTKVNEIDKIDDIQIALKALTAAVGKMVENMSREEAEQVVNDLQTFSNEASSEKPRRKWWQLSSNGIIEAAQAVGKLGKGVLDTLPKAIAILEKIP